MNSKVIKEIKRIASTIPEELIKGLMTRQLAYPTLIEMVEKALADDTVNPKMKERLQAIKDSGKLLATEEVVDKAGEALLDKWWSEEVELAIKEGRLPKPKKNDGTLEVIKKKGKQYARRSNRKSEAESAGGDNR